MQNSILIVDDEPDQLKTLASWLIRAGYRVVSVHHPRQALEAASFRPFQIAILDASLPEMDGLDLMQRLKRMQRDVQVIILSGYDYPQSQAKSEGAIACLTKPCKPSRLQAIIEAALGHAVCDLSACDHAASYVA